MAPSRGSISDERSPQVLALAVSAASAWVIGLLAVLCDFFQYSRYLDIGLRALFAICTCAAIGLALIPNPRPATLHLDTRSVSRWVYILLYSLALVHVGLCLGRTTHLNDGFQFYIVASIAPLWVIRAIAHSGSTIEVQ